MDLNDLFKTFSVVLDLLWPAFAVAQLLIALRAKRKFSIDGPSLMVLGSGMSLTVAIFYLVVNISQKYFSYDAYGSGYYATYSPVLTLIGAVGNLLFLVGLGQFITNVSSKERPGDSRLLDRY